MSYGATLVYSSNGAINASAAEVLIRKNTSAIYFLNIGTAAIQISLNEGAFSVFIPGTPAGLVPDYFCIPGNYFTFRSNVSAANLHVYAVA